MLNRGSYRLSEEDLALIDDGHVFAELSVPYRFESWSEAPGVLRGLCLSPDKAIRLAKQAERTIKAGQPFIGDKVIVRRVAA